MDEQILLQAIQSQFTLNKNINAFVEKSIYIYIYIYISYFKNMIID